MPDEVRGGSAAGGPLAGFGIESLGANVSIEIDNAVAIAGGEESTPGNFAGDFDRAGSQVVTTSEFVRPSLRSTDYVPALGAVVRLLFGGEPETTHFVQFSQVSTLGFQLVGVEGLSLVDLSASLPLTTAVLDASGQGEKTLTMPQDPALLSQSFVIQSVAFGAALPRLAPPIVITARP